MLSEEGVAFKVKELSLRDLVGKIDCCVITAMYILTSTKSKRVACAQTKRLGSQGGFLGRIQMAPQKSTRLGGMPIYPFSSRPHQPRKCNYFPVTE